MKVSIAHTAVSATIFMALAGCTSINREVARQDYLYPQSITTAEITDFQKMQQKKAEAIATQSVGEIKTIFYKEYQQRFSGSEMNGNVRAVGNDKIEVDFKWESPRAFFPPGEYDIKNIKAHDGRDGMAFLDLVASGVNDMTKKFRQQNINVEVEAIFYGSADGLPIRSAGLRYRGEYGEVTLPSESTLVNNAPQTINIRPQQSLTNEELAALRAWSLREFAHNGFDRSIPMRDSFEISASPIVGAEQRSAKVRFVIKPSRPNIS